jgi:hypothetical protein
MIGTRSSFYDDDGPDYDLEDARQEARFERRRQNLLMRYPDCRDPDHPGCECCEEGDEE